MARRTPRTAAQWDRLAPKSRWRWERAYGGGRLGRRAYLQGRHLSLELRGHATVPRPVSARQALRDRPADRRAKAVLAEARDHPNRSLTRIAMAHKTTPDAVLRHTGSAWEMDARGRWRPKQSDDLWRVLPVVSGGRVYDRVAIQGSVEATLVADHLNALDDSLAGREGPEVLNRFRGRVVRGVLPDGTEVELELEADFDVLVELDEAGELDGLIVES